MPAKTRAFNGAFAVIVALGLALALPSVNGMAQSFSTEIISDPGSGTGMLLQGPIAVDGAGGREGGFR